MKLDLFAQVIYRDNDKVELDSSLIQLFYCNIQYRANKLISSRRSSYWTRLRRALPNY